MAPHALQRAGRLARARVALPDLLARVQAHACHDRHAPGPGRQPRRDRRALDLVVASGRGRRFVGRAAHGVRRPRVGTAAYHAPLVALTAASSAQADERTLEVWAAAD